MTGRLGPGQRRLQLAQEPPPLSAPAPATPVAVKRLRILIIEDNPDSAEMLRLLLELLGHEVRVAYTGTDGVQQAMAQRPDVVLSDIGLPELDGWGVARELRRNPATAGVRLIAVTGYGTDENKRRAKEVGYDHLLTKPTDPDALLALMSAD
jgi:two-component system CheB/CheR fusion protein